MSILATPSVSAGDAPDPRGVKSVSKLKTPVDHDSALQTLWRGRQLLEQQWRLNLAFYKGRQYSYYNRSSRQIQQLPVADGDKPRFRVRIVSNQIMAGAQSLLAKYTKTRPMMHATPGTGSDRDLKAAQLAERLLDFWWEDFQLDDALEEALLWGIIGGQGFWQITWDAQAGRQMTYLLDPNGQPVVDQTLDDLFRAQLNANGVQPQERVVYLGDIDVCVVSPFDLYWDPTVRNWTECKWVYHVSYLDPDVVKARYGVTLAPNAISAAPDTTLPSAQTGMQSGTSFNVRKIVTGYFKPQPGMPQGRIVCFSPGAADFLDDKKWDLPTHDLPYAKFPGIRVPGEVYDQSVIEHAIPMQKELNRTISQIVEFKNLSVKPQWMAPRGALRTRLTNEPGAVFEYTPIAGAVPQQVALQSLPSYVFTHLDNVSQRLNDVFGVNEVMQGQVPPNVEAGVAIDLLQEMATDRLAPTIRLMELSLARAGRLMLNLAKAYYNEPRLLKITGFGSSSQVKEFTKADIEGAVDVIAEAGSALPRTRAGKQARVEWMLAQGLIQPEQAYKYIDTADLTGVAAILQLDEDEALREQDGMVAGKPYNQTALQQAQQAVAQGVDPDSGQPLQSPQQAQQIVDDAGYAPTYFQNHQVHMDIHTRYMKGLEYQALPPELQQRMQDHVSKHFQIFLSFPTPVSPVAPRVTWNIRSSVGPTVGAEILRKSGVNTDAQELEEPPMPWATESWSDMVKAGVTDPMMTSPAAVEQQQQQAQQAQEQQQAQAQQQQQMEQQAQQHQLTQLSRAQQMQHAQQVHQMKLIAQAHQVATAEDKRKAIQRQISERAAAAAQNGRAR